MAEKNRHLKVIRSKTNYTSNALAKSGLNTVFASLSDGELAIASYQDSNSVNGTAIILGVKNSGKVFFIDNQNILNQLGLTKPTEANGEYTLSLNKIKDIDNKAVFGDDVDTIQEALNALAEYAKDTKNLTLGSGSVKDVAQLKSDGGVYSPASTSDQTDASVTSTDKYVVTKSVFESGELKEKKEAFSLMYTSVSPSGLPMPAKVGDFAKNTKAGELNQYSLSEIIDKILIPTIYPTVSNPSASIGNAGGGTVKVGTKMPTPTASFNRGKVTLDRGDGKMGDGTTVSSTGKPYVGEQDGNATFTYSFTPGSTNSNAGVAQSGASATNASFTGGTTIFSNVGTYRFSTNVKYKAGETFENSKNLQVNPMPIGDGSSSVANPHAAGSVSNTGGDYNVSVPVYIGIGDSTTAASALTEQGLKTWGAMTFSNVNLNGFAEAANKCVVIYTPRKVEYMRHWNTLTSKYDIAMNLGTPTTTTIKINEIDVPYFKYVSQNNGQLGSIRFEIKTY